MSLSSSLSRLLFLIWLLAYVFLRPNLSAQVVEVDYTFGGDDWARIDSLEAALERAPDSLRLPLLNQLAAEYRSYASFRKGVRDTAIAIAREARWRAQQQTDTLALIQALGHLSSLYRWDSTLKDSMGILYLQRSQLLLGYGYRLKASYAQWGPDDRRRLDDYLAILPDPTGTRSLDSVRQIYLAGGFGSNESSKQSLIQGGDCWWGRVLLRSEDSVWREHTFTSRGWDSVEVFLLRPDGEREYQLTGAAINKKVLPLEDEPGLFRCALPPGGQVEMFLRFKGFAYGDVPTSISVRHLNYASYLQGRVKEHHINGIFQGVVWVQLLFFLLLFLVTRDRIYGYFALYVLGLGIFILNVNYFSDIPSFNGTPTLVLYLVAIWLTCVGMLTFSAAYLDLVRHIPSWKKPLRAYIWFFSAVSLLTIAIVTGLESKAFTSSSQPDFAVMIAIGLSILLVFCLVLVSLAFLLIWGIKVLRKGYTPAKYYLISTAFLLLGVVGPLMLVPFAQQLAEMGFFQEVDLGILVEGGIALQLCLSALGVGHQRNQLEKERREALESNLRIQQQINAATDRFVPYEFLKTLGRESILDVHLGDQVEKFVTVFFSDIRDYTSLSEQMTPQQNFLFLNHYLGRVGPVIKTNKGFVNQYYGDGIMALFLGEDSGIKSSEDAVRAGIEMHRELHRYNDERTQKGRESIQIGIGIHSGPLMLGVIGDEKRMDVGVVSDTVNTAARMEGLTKHYGASLVVSETTFKGISDPRDFHYRYLGLVQVKGRTAPVQVYDFFDGDPARVMDKKGETLRRFQEGMEAYFARKFDEAAKAFRSILEQFPDDKAALYYLNRSEVLLREGVPEGWTGVELVDKK